MNYEYLEGGSMWTELPDFQFKDYPNLSNIAIIIEAKPREDGGRQTLLAVDVFEEMIALDNFIHNITF